MTKAKLKARVSKLLKEINLLEEVVRTGLAHSENQEIRLERYRTHLINLNNPALLLKEIDPKEVQDLKNTIAKYEELNKKPMFRFAHRFHKGED